jgi:flagellar hook-basal body complex protein FliE
VELKGIGSGLGLGGAFPEVGGAKSTSAVEGAGKFFSELVSKVNDMQTQSDQAIQGLATGENKNLHEVMISMEKASISFQFLSQVRNKAVEAYQEVMRMQV